MLNKSLTLLSTIAHTLLKINKIKIKNNKTAQILGLVFVQFNETTEVELKILDFRCQILEAVALVHGTKENPLPAESAFA